jgi:hypothetical protein
MECVRCFSPNELHRRFCGQCGAPLAAVCPRCGFINRVVDRFCGGCGSALAPQAAEHPQAPLDAAPAAVRSPAPARRAPLPAAGAAPAARGAEALSKQDLTELLKPPPAPTAPALPQKVSQDDLDHLFTNSK